MLELLLGIYFSYQNALIAKAKGFSTIIWVIVTLLAFFGGVIIGGFILVGLFYHGSIHNQAALRNFFMQLNMLNISFIYFSAIGGCLLVRYRLEQKKSKLPQKAEKEESDQADY